MNNENLEVLEMDKQPNLAYKPEVNGNDMADDFFDDDLVELDFNGLDDGQESSGTNHSKPVMPLHNVGLNFGKKDLQEPLQDKQTNSNDLFNTFIPADKEVNVSEANSEDKEDLDNSYVLSNFDVLFDSLYNDVVGANNLISDLIEKKSSLNKNEKLLEDFKEKFEKEKEDFKSFVEEQKKAIENEKSQATSLIESKQAHLRSEEARFNEDSESKKKEISLLEQSLELEKEKFESYKNNFEEQNRVELDKIKFEKEKLEREKEKFETDKKLSLETIKNGQKDLQMQQEQFAKYKELEQKKLDLEEKNLSQSCARFKELVSQFNSGFEQLPNNE